MKDIQILYGERVKQLRLEKHLSQEKLANISEVDRTYVAQVESGKRNISLRNIQKLCCGLDVTLGEFFSDSLFDKEDEEL